MTRIVGLAMSFLFMCVAAVAQPPGFGPGGFGSERKLVKQFDKDGDGRLNSAERAAARASLKSQGGPGPRNFGPRRPFGNPGSWMSDSLLKALDTDKNGKLTEKELLSGAEAFFAAADGKKSGSLTVEAMAKQMNKNAATPPGFGPPPGGRGNFGPGTIFANAVCAKADADKNGKVTLKELTEAAKTAFASAAGKNGKELTSEQLATAMGSLMPRPGGFGRPGRGGFGGPGFGRGNREPASPGRKLQPEQVESHPKATLYDPKVLRTLFLEFENNDWEAELADFKGTDVEVPATLTVDGKKYPNIGVHFRGMSSFMGVPAGYKRSLNLSLDFVEKKQRLYGYKTLNLLNGHEDDSLMSTVLYSHIARQYIPTPKANFVRVVINGECWGIYTNVQQFNKDFLKENYKTGKGARWKIRGNPGGRGGLEYFGENADDYKRIFQIKSKDDEKSWKALINLCRVLNKTPTDRLEKALEPIVDLDGLLRFLALDVALINNDGYWTRASDYSLYLDPMGKFHFIPHDMNEAFTEAHGGPGGFGGPGQGGRQRPGGFERPGGFDRRGDRPQRGFNQPGRPGDREQQPRRGGGRGFGPPGGGFGGPGRGGVGVKLDPLVGVEAGNTRMPLRSRVLAVPSLKKRYLAYVRKIAEKSLDWKSLGPVVAQFRTLISDDVKLDTRKLSTFAAFQQTTSELVKEVAGSRGRHGMNLKAFADKRRSYLLQKIARQ